MDIFDPDVQKKGFVIILIALCALLGFLIGYLNIQSGGIAAPRLFASDSSNKTNIPVKKTLATTTSYSTDTPNPNLTELPTIIPKLTNTVHPSQTQAPTSTPTATPTPTETQTPFIPTFTRTPTMSPTSHPVYPTDTPVPPTELPLPTTIIPEPIVIESCNVDPFTVPIDNNTSITFIVHFSSRVPGYGFEAVVGPEYPGQSGCSGSDDDGDGMAYCVGSSGTIPEPKTVYVTLKSLVGDCVVSYSSR